MKRIRCLLGVGLLYSLVVGCSIRPRPSRDAVDPSLSPTTANPQPAEAKHLADRPAALCHLSVLSDSAAIPQFSIARLSMEKRIHIEGCKSHGPYEIMYSTQTGRIHQGREGVWFTAPDRSFDPSGHIRQCDVLVSAVCPHGAKASTHLVIRLAGSRSERKNHTPMNPTPAFRLTLVVPHEGQQIQGNFTVVRGEVEGVAATEVSVVVVNRWGVEYPQSVPVRLSDGKLESGCYLGDEGGGMGEFFTIFLRTRDGRRSRSVKVYRVQ